MEFGKPRYKILLCIVDPANDFSVNLRNVGIYRLKYIDYDPPVHLAMHVSYPSQSVCAWFKIAASVGVIQAAETVELHQNQPKWFYFLNS